MCLQGLPLSVYFLLFISLACAQGTIDAGRQLETHQAQAAAYLKNNRPDLAVAEFRAIVSIDPENADAQRNLGVLLFFRGDYAQAAPYLRAALKLQPNASRLQALLGMCEKRNGEMALAESDLSESFPRLEDQKVKIQAGIELAEIYYAAGLPAKAAMIVPVLQALRPDDPHVLYLGYRIYSELARQSALGIATFAPDSARMQQVMAEELARQGNYPDAVVHFRQALQADPHLPGAHFELAEMLNILGNTASAAVEYRAALADDPSDAKSESRLGELALRAADGKAASQHFGAALRLQPDDAATCLGMAKVLVGENQLDRALTLLERATQSDPLDSSIHYQLGLVYRRLGRLDDSRREMKEFATLKESNARLRQVYRQMGLQPKPRHPEDEAAQPTSP